MQLSQTQSRAFLSLSLNFPFRPLSGVPFSKFLLPFLPSYFNHFALIKFQITSCTSFLMKICQQLTSIHPTSALVRPKLLTASMKLLSIILQLKHQKLILFLLAFAFLLMPTLISPFQFMAQGRELPKAHLRKDEEIGIKIRSLIGSRPPRCKERCRNCGKCEAVQVPIETAIKFSTPRNKVEYSRGDGISTYKPMCWKCKCGDFFFNP